MKAVLLRAFGGAENFHDAEVPQPEVAPGEVRVALEAASFNPVDWQVRKGGPEGGDARSMILGRDFSGRVDAVHASVAGFRAGDEVFGYVAKLASSGTYAECVSVPAELLARKPASLTHEEAAAAPVAAITASLALERAQASEATSLFIAGGAGGVGGFAIPLARYLGVRRLVTTAGNATSRAYLLERCGLAADQVVDYKDSGFIARAMERNGGAFDVALDLVGGRMLSACCELLAVDGHLASAIDAPSRDEFEILFRKNASFHAVGAHAYSLAKDRGSWLRYRTILDRWASLVDRGAIPRPHVRVVGKLSAEVVRQAHALLEGNAVQGKLVMTF